MEAEGHDTGFDAANECMVNLIEKGIIDPTKVKQHRILSSCFFRGRGT
jgi:chaperonin GroEL (HSP60 family)